MRISDRWTSVYPPWVGYEGLDDIPSQHKKQWYICISIYRYICIYMKICPFWNPKGIQNGPKWSKREPQGANEPSKTPLVSRVEQKDRKMTPKDVQLWVHISTKSLVITKNNVQESAQNVGMEMQEEWYQNNAWKNVKNNGFPISLQNDDVRQLLVLNKKTYHFIHQSSPDPYIFRNKTDPQTLPKRECQKTLKIYQNGSQKGATLDTNPKTNEKKQDRGNLVLTKVGWRGSPLHGGGWLRDVPGPLVVFIY